MMQPDIIIIALTSGVSATLWALLIEPRLNGRKRKGGFDQPIDYFKKNKKGSNEKCL